MATIQARSKYGKRFTISVEDKHQYINFDSQTIRLNKMRTDTIDDNGYCIGQNVIARFELSDNITITQGPGEEQRIGNKVFMKFLHWTYSICLNGESIIQNLSHGELIDLFMRFRVMVVKFDTAMTKQDLVDWFKGTYIYFRQFTVSGGGTTYEQSVHQTKLRESTPWTGKFKILYDKKIKMGKKKNVKISNISVAIKQNLNFDNTSNRCTDGSFKYIYGLVIGPCFNNLDTDAVSADKTYNFSTNYVPLAYVNGVLKYEYYDM